MKQQTCCDSSGMGKTSSACAASQFPFQPEHPLTLTPPPNPVVSGCARMYCTPASFNLEISYMFILNILFLLTLSSVNFLDIRSTALTPISIRIKQLLKQRSEQKRTLRCTVCLKKTWLYCSLKTRTFAAIELT